jgi:hypothetical protein
LLLLLLSSSPSSSVSVCRAISILLHHVVSIELLLCLKLVLPFKNSLSTGAHCYTLRVLVAYYDTTFLRWLSTHLLLHHDYLLFVELLSLRQLVCLLLRLHDLSLDLLQLLLLLAIFRPVLNFIEHLLELLDVLHLFFHLEVVDLVLLNKLIELV